MSDTINREYATRYFIGLQALDKITNDNYDGKITFEEVVSSLGVIPSAEPEIIQCKDCKHYDPEAGDDSYAVGYCPFIGSHLVMSKGFCAWGERREE